jgi:hypothetical protein
MKHCSKCHTNYTQEGINFCRNDGNELSEDTFDYSNTLLMPKTKENKKYGIWFKLLEYDLDLYEKGLSSPVTIAGDYAQLGNKEKALEWLEEAYSRQSRDLPYLKNNPSLSELSSDPQYKELLQRIESLEQ